ncbi:MAG: carboxymuconolactone decarboxylase family protein [Acidimicrobiales bacterium]|nr:carboxymuconolactone decarboxylase family protein [Acidimicrobiales bacterium]
MADEALEPTDENLMMFVFGDEVSSKRMREAMTGPAASTYNQIVSPTNGPLWARRILPVKTTVLMNLAILACLNRPHELYTRVVGLLRGGISVEEIQEVFLHIGFYVGNPAGVEASVTLHEAMEYLNSRGIAFREKAEA